MRQRLQKRQGLFFSVAGTAFVQVFSAGILFLNSLVLARVLGTVGFGAYDFADATIEVLAVFVLTGFDRLAIQRLAIFETQQAWGLLRGMIRFMQRRALLITTFVIPIAGLLALFRFRFLTSTPPILMADPLKIPMQNYENQLALVTFWFALLLLPLRARLKLNQVTLQGIRRVIEGYIPDYALRPTLLLIGVLVVHSVTALNAQGVVGIHIAAAGIALAVSIELLRRFTPQQARNALLETKSREWTKAALPFMLISGMTLLNLRGGSTVVGAVSDLETVALYGISVRITALIALLLAATSAVVAPRIASLYASGQKEQLQRLVTLSTRGILAVAFPASIALILFGNIVLSLFGRQFTAAHSALIILSIGQIVNAGTGVVGWVVMMTGYERVMARVVTLAAILHLSLIVILTPLYGLEGAATATALTNIFNNLALTLFAYRTIGINSTAFAWPGRRRSRQ
jgi:O-antigen/teichoic acid export membrane protein